LILGHQNVDQDWGLHPSLCDLLSREIVGWTISTSHTTKFVIEAFLDAVKTVDKPMIVHTDQGAEYNAKEYTKSMKDLEIKVSMSAKASPWENGYQESFYDNFKAKFLNLPV